MKRVRWSLAMAAGLVVALGPASAHAEEPVAYDRWGLSAGGGIAGPTGAYADVLQWGPVVDLTGEHWLSRQVSLVLLAGLISNSPKPEFRPPDEKASARLYRVFLLGRYAAPGTGVRPYGDLGIGAVNRKFVLEDLYGNGTEVLDESRTRFGGLVGAGLVVPAGTGIDVLPEVSYLWVPLSEDDVIDASSQNSLLATVALRLRFGG